MIVVSGFVRLTSKSHSMVVNNVFICIKRREGKTLFFLIKRIEIALKFILTRNACERSSIAKHNKVMNKCFICSKCDQFIASVLSYVCILKFSNRFFWFFFRSSKWSTKSRLFHRNECEMWCDCENNGTSFVDSFVFLLVCAFSTSFVYSPGRCSPLAKSLWSVADVRKDEKFFAIVVLRNREEIVLQMIICRRWPTNDVISKYHICNAFHF